MKVKYSIGLFILSATLIYLLSFRVYENICIKEDTTQMEKSVTADGQAFSNECYYLYEVNGYVVVFLNDRKTPYEYTDILYEDLPELIRLEIRNGKYIKDSEELYGFLENYSS